jgi:hypothetical protein
MSLTLYDAMNRQLSTNNNAASNNNEFVSPPKYPHHASIGYIDGQSKKKFIFQGPADSVHAHRAMGICQSMEAYTWKR